MKTKLLILTMLFLAAGCGKDAENTETESNDAITPKTKISQETPNDTVKMLVQGVENMDKEAAMALFSGDETTLQAVSGGLDMAFEFQKFEAEAVKAYGQAGWDVISADQGDGMDFNTMDKQFEAFKNLGAADFKINGDKAVCTIPGEAMPMEFVKKDGLWYIDALKLSPAGNGSGQVNNEMIKASQGILKAIAQAVKDTRLQIGQDGVTPEKLKEAMGKAMGQAMMKAMMAGGMPGMEDMPNMEDMPDFPTPPNPN